MNPVKNLLKKLFSGDNKMLQGISALGLHGYVVDTVFDWHAWFTSERQRHCLTQILDVCMETMSHYVMFID